MRPAPHLDELLHAARRLERLRARLRLRRRQLRRLEDEVRHATHHVASLRADLAGWSAPARPEISLEEGLDP